MTDYAPGHVKQDPETLATATKVNDNMPEAWLIATLDHGGRFATYGEIAHWDDLTPPTTSTNATAPRAPRPTRRR